MFGFHPTELIIVLVILLVVFGPKRLPEIGSAIGKGIREFKKASNEVTNSLSSPQETDIPKQIETASQEVKDSQE